MFICSVLQLVWMRAFSSFTCHLQHSGTKFLSFLVGTSCVHGHLIESRHERTSDITELGQTNVMDLRFSLRWL
jgi:hypothetical protein